MQEQVKHNKRMLLAVFLSGASVMILELTGTRLFAPYIGSSVFTWTALIGVILGCMSYGYYLGGVRADKTPCFKELSRIAFYAGLSIFMIHLASNPILIVLSNFSIDLRIKAILASFILFGLPGVLLGMILPFCIRLSVLDISSSGKTVGLIYALSTFGSIVGTFLGGFFLVSYLGTLSIYVLCAILMLFVSILFSCTRTDYLKFGTILFLIVYLFLFTNKKTAFALLDVDTKYHRVLLQETVENDRKVRWLLTDPLGAQSATFVDDFNEIYSEYAKNIGIAIEQLPTKKKFLILGGGAYSIPKYLLSKYPQAIVDVVEIDPGLTEIAKEYFGLKLNKNLNIIHKDARMFINTSQFNNHYDAIIFDAFSSSPSIPFHLVTKESFARLLKMLKKDGLFAMNVISAATGKKSMLLSSIVNTLSLSVPFQQTFVVSPEKNKEDSQNILIFAAFTKNVLSMTKNNITAEKLVVGKTNLLLSDDFAPVEAIYAPLLK